MSECPRCESPHHGLPCPRMRLDPAKVDAYIADQADKIAARREVAARLSAVADSEWDEVYAMESQLAEFRATVNRRGPDRRDGPMTADVRGWCDDCGHGYVQHYGGACWGRIDFDDALGDGALCGCNEFVECDCGCRDDEALR